jgi:hypothetical protein
MYFDQSASVALSVGIKIIFGYQKFVFNLGLNRNIAENTEIKTVKKI